MKTDGGRYFATGNGAMDLDLPPQILFHFPGSFYENLFNLNSFENTYGLPTADLGDTGEGGGDGFDLSWFDLNKLDAIAGGIGLSMGVKEVGFDAAKKFGELSGGTEKYLKVTMFIGKATGIIGAGVAWKGFYNNPSVASGFKALGTTALALGKTSPFVGVGLAVLDLTGGSDWIYGKVGDAVNEGVSYFTINK